MKKNQKPDTQQKGIAIDTNKSSLYTKLYKIVSKYPISLISLLAFVIYFQTFFFGFVKLDDIPILQFNYEYFSDISNIPDSFTRDAFVRDVGSFYRPLQTTMFIIETNIAGGEPFIFHIINVILHILTCIGVYLLFKKLNFSKDIQTIAGILYAIHPLFTHAVSWIPARNDLLITLFCIYGFIAFMNYLEKGKFQFLLVHYLLLVLALFSKETAAVFPVMCFIFILLFKRDMIRHSRTMISIAGWLLLVTIWFIIRMSAIGISWNEGDFGFTQLLNNSLVIPELIAKLFIPFFIIVLSTFKIWTSVAGLLIIIAMVYLSFKSKSNNSNYLIFGAAWFILLIIPGTMYSHFHSDFFYDYLDHRAYLPMIGVLMILAVLMPKAWSNLSHKKVFITFTLVVLFLSAYNLIQQRNYTDPISFWTSAANSNPKVAGFHLVLGELLLRSDRYEEAEHQFLISLKYKPEVIDSYCYLGEIYDKQKKHAKAINVLRMGVKVDSLNFFALNTMAKNYYALNMYDEAVAEWKKALSIEPDKTRIIELIVKSYSLNNQHQLAIPYVEQMKQKAVGDYKSFISEFYFQWAAADYVKKIELIKLYVDIGIENDRSAKALNRAGIIFMEKNHPELAIGYWNEALKINPKDTLLLTNLVQFYLMVSNDKEKAKYYSEKLIEAGGNISPAMKNALNE